MRTLAKRKNGNTKNDATTANLGFEAKLRAAADARHARCVGVDPELGEG
jgi:hypothetical protein